MSENRPIWHGWTNTLTDGRSSVTSRPLHTEAVANRWFPKVRSWIRLGAPIELLSPLSVARILLLTTLITWPTMAALAGLEPVAAAALTVGSAAGVVLLLRRAVLDATANTVVAAATFAATLAALALSDHDRRALAAALIVVVLALFLGLFLRPRPMVVAISVQAVSMLWVARFTADGVGFSGSVLLVITSAFLTLMAAAMARTSRSAGALDADTGVPNARGLRATLDTMGCPALVVTVRLAGVAAARDALGHDAGSELIRRAVEDLGQVVAADASVGRGTDDEVVVIVPLGPDVDRTKREAIDWVHAAIGSGSYLVGEIEVVLEHHIGFAVGGHGVHDGIAEQSAEETVDRTSTVDALRQSALAARRAESAGDAAQTWDGVPGTLTAADLTLLADLRSAADRGQLWLAYQPQVRMPDGAVLSAEALLRWKHPVLGEVSPGRFIPLAEKTGLIDRLTDWVVAEALDAQARWRSVGRDISVSVNISPLSLRRGDFATRIAEQLVERSLPASCLTLEVTESNAFDVPEAVERLAPLRELGVSVAIDDFGTGYTSLAILPQLPLDEIKIDRQFVRDVLVNPASDAIVRSMCELGHRIGLVVVAEGAEDQEVVDHLTVAGYDLIQGFFFARPMAECDLDAWLVDRAVDASREVATGALHSSVDPRPSFIGRTEAAAPTMPTGPHSTRAAVSDA